MAYIRFFLISFMTFFCVHPLYADGQVDPRVHWSKGKTWIVKTTYPRLETTHAETDQTRDVYWEYRVADDKLIKYDYTTRRLYVTYFILAQPHESLNLRFATSSASDDPYGLKFSRLFLFVRNDQVSQAELENLAAQGGLYYNDGTGRHSLRVEQAAEVIRNNRGARDEAQQLILVGFRYQRRDSVNQYHKIKPEPNLPISTNYSIIPYDMPLFPLAIAAGERQYPSSEEPENAVTTELVVDAPTRVRVSFKSTLDQTPIRQLWDSALPWFQSSMSSGSRSELVAVSQKQIEALVARVREERSRRVTPRTLHDLQRQVLERRENNPTFDSGEKMDRIRIPEARGREYEDAFRNLQPRGQ